jgi:mRNA interferase RelE/StbE
LPRINQDIRARIKKAIEERILVAPQEYGTPLRKTLKGYWKLRVGDYRVVYKISDKMVTVLCICHRKNVYKKASIR